MFGKELSEETKIQACKMLKMDRERLDHSSVNTLRFEIEELYDNALSETVGAAMNNSVVEPIIEHKKEVDKLYSLLMNDIEDHLNVGGILI